MYVASMRRLPRYVYLPSATATFCHATIRPADHAIACTYGTVRRRPPFGQRTDACNYLTSTATNIFINTEESLHRLLSPKKTIERKFMLSCASSKVHLHRLITRNSSRRDQGSSTGSSTVSLQIAFPFEPQSPIQPTIVLSPIPAT